MIVVLGCKLSFERGAPQRLNGPGLRRVSRAAEVYRDRARHAERDREPEPLVLASGGRAWAGVVEADAFAHELERQGVPAHAILRERWSHSTRENARFVGRLLRARGLTRIVLVTCDFHVPRARFLFEHEGLAVEAFGAPSSSSSAPWHRRMAGRSREAIATMLDRRLVTRHSP